MSITDSLLYMLFISSCHLYLGASAYVTFCNYLRRSLWPVSTIPPTPSQKHLLPCTYLKNDIYFFNLSWFHNATNAGLMNAHCFTYLWLSVWSITGDYTLELPLNVNHCTWSGCWLKSNFEMLNRAKCVRSQFIYSLCGEHKFSFQKNTNCVSKIDEEHHITKEVLQKF